jgi:hypothetical protein
MITHIRGTDFAATLRAAAMARPVRTDIASSK